MKDVSGTLSRFYIAVTIVYEMLNNIIVIVELRNGWLIRTASKSFAVYAATSTEKQEWMAHINKCIGDLLRKSKFLMYLHVKSFD